MFSDNQSISRLDRIDTRDLMAENAWHFDDDSDSELIMSHFSNYRKNEAVFSVFNIFAILGFVIGALLFFI